MKKLLIILLVLLGIREIYQRSNEVTLGPGVMAPDAPVQRDIAAPQSHQVGEFTITEVAHFEIRAKVLGRENYYLGKESALSPLDLALGWGRMSDESIIEQFSIRQNNRFYFWRVDAYPIPRREIETSSANMHLIPANDVVKAAMDRVRKGDIVALSGSLVNVTGDDGWYWRSSLSRSDTGSGACELIWVEGTIYL